MSIEILTDADALALRVADLFALAAQEAAAARGRFAVALSGGETPRALYKLLARQQFSQKVPGAASHLYWGDERCVPPDDPRSNYGVARDAFIKHVPIAPANVHRMRGEDLRRRPPTSYDAELRRLAAQDGRARRARSSTSSCSVSAATATRPRSSRTATPRRSRTRSARRRRRRTVAAAHRDRAGDQRRAPRVVRRERRRQGRHGRGGASRGCACRMAVPAQGVAPVHGTLTWFLDEAAAAELSPDARA